MTGVPRQKSVRSMVPKKASSDTTEFKTQLRAVREAVSVEGGQDERTDIGGEAPADRKVAEKREPGVWEKGSHEGEARKKRASAEVVRGGELRGKKSGPRGRRRDGEGANEKRGQKDAGRRSLRRRRNFCLKKRDWKSARGRKRK